MKDARFAAMIFACAGALALGGAAVGQDLPAPTPKHVTGPTPHGPGSVEGEWYNFDYQRGRVYHPEQQVVLDIDGKRPPLRPEYEKIYEQRIKDAAAGHPIVTPLSQCLPSGVPAMFFYPQNSIEFLENPKLHQVTMLNQQFTYFRLVRMNAKHLEDPDPTFMGDAVGHWEGNTLVVDTIGLNDKTLLDQPGLPHSESLHVIERWTRTAPDKMELVVTIDDPKVYTRTWQTKMHFQADDRPMDEYVCENNRNINVGEHIGTQLGR